MTTGGRGPAFYVYGICRAGRTLPGGASYGVRGRPVRLVACDDLAAVASPLPAGHDVGDDVRAAVAHARVVDALHEEGTVLPVRYGCIVRDAPGVVTMVASSAGAYRESLTILDGCVEMGVRILVAPRETKREPKPHPHTRPASGQGYLRERRRGYARQDEAIKGQAELAARCQVAFADLCVAYRENRDASSQTMSLAFLVRRTDESRFREAFLDLVEGEQIGMLLTGPWPPYSFTP